MKAQSDPECRRGATIVTDLPTAGMVSAPPADSGAPINLETYYTEAGMDYRAWSRAFNMHFGYWRWPQNPFALKAMLEEMSRQVFRRLAPADGDRLLDLGCGVGAPARALIARNSVAVTALTRVPWQIAMAHNLGPGTAPRGTVEWFLADYTATCRALPIRAPSPSRRAATPPAWTKSCSSASAPACWCRALDLWSRTAS